MVQRCATPHVQPKRTVSATVSRTSSIDTSKFVTRFPSTATYNPRDLSKPISIPMTSLSFSVPIIESYALKPTHSTTVINRTFLPLSERSNTVTATFYNCNISTLALILQQNSIKAGWNLMFLEANVPFGGVEVNSNIYSFSFL